MSAYGFDESSARAIAATVRAHRRRGPAPSDRRSGGVDPTPAFWIEITGETGGGLYSWKKVHPSPTASSGWTDAGASGTGTAREANATTGIPTGARFKAEFIGYNGTSPRYLFVAAISDIQWNTTTKKIQVRYSGATWVDKITFGPC